MIVVLGASGNWNWSSSVSGFNGSGLEEMRWYSNTETFCGLPSSSTVKSSAFRPSTVWPALSLALTSTITRFALALNVGVPGAGSLTGV